MIIMLVFLSVHFIVFFGYLVSWWLFFYLHFILRLVGFHSEIFPFELGKQVKIAVNDIPYRPII